MTSNNMSTTLYGESERGLREREKKKQLINGRKFLRDMDSLFV